MKKVLKLMRVLLRAVEIEQTAAKMLNPQEKLNWSVSCSIFTSNDAYFTVWVDGTRFKVSIEREMK
jgi:hypothetical protein